MNPQRLQWKKLPANASAMLDEEYEFHSREEVEAADAWIEEHLLPIISSGYCSTNDVLEIIKIGLGLEEKK